MRYRCPRCNYTTDQRSNILRHVKKDKLCNDKTGNNIIPKCDNIICLDDEIFNCVMCNKSFSSSKNLSRHVEECTISQGKLKNLVIEFAKENRELKRQLISSMTTQVNIHNGDVNINNNLYLPNNFEDSNLNCITPEFNIDNIRRSVNSAIANVVEMVHFNPELPENHNVCISDKSRNNGLILENGKWITTNGNELVEKIYDKYYLKCIYEFSEDPIIQELYPEVIQLCTTYETRINGHEQKSYDKIRDVMYNNKEFCLARKRQMEDYERRHRLNLLE
jgi:uncharacterized C2H2 Zn-finger protein